MGYVIIVNKDLKSNGRKMVFILIKKLCWVKLYILLGKLDLKYRLIDWFFLFL